MSDAEAYALLFKLRWPDGVPVCPHCKGEGAWEIAARKTSRDGLTHPRPLLKCKRGACRKQFTITSGTLFHSHKTSLRDILLQVYHFSRSAKGLAPLREIFEIGTSYKAAFVFHHKLRRAISDTVRKQVVLRGEVEADLVFVGGHKRQTNQAKNRVDRRLKRYRSDRRQGVLAIRERGPGGRVVTALCANESQAVGYIYRYVEQGARLFVDAASGLTVLDGHYDVRVIDHSKAFSRIDPEDGVVVSTNQAESYNSRLRRAEQGVHHRVAGRHILNYTDEMGWRETCRRDTARTQFERLLGICLAAVPSKAWLNYWGEAA